MDNSITTGNTTAELQKAEKLVRSYTKANAETKRKLGGGGAL